MELKHTIICWTPSGGDWALPSNYLYKNATVGRTALVPFPDRTGASDTYAMTSGACFISVREMRQNARQQFVLSTALGMILRDGLTPAEVHRALWPIDEYRDALPPDTPSPERLESELEDEQRLQARRAKAALYRRHEEHWLAQQDKLTEGERAHYEGEAAEMAVNNKRAFEARRLKAAGPQGSI